MFRKTGLYNTSICPWERESECGDSRETLWGTPMNRESDSIAVLTALVMAGTCLFLNADGYHIHVCTAWSGNIDVGDITAEPPDITWVHGWPIGYLTRSSIRSLQSKAIDTDARLVGAYALHSRWPIDNAQVGAFNAWYALADVAVCSAIVVGTFYGVRRIAASLHWRFRFSIRTLLLAMVFISCCLVFWRPLLANRLVIEAFAIGMVLLGVCLCLLAMLPSRWLDKVRSQAASA
jgi:hypothetical protein